MIAKPDKNGQTIYCVNCRYIWSATSFNKHWPKKSLIFDTLLDIAPYITRCAVPRYFDRFSLFFICFSNYFIIPALMLFRNLVLLLYLQLHLCCGFRWQTTTIKSHESTKMHRYTEWSNLLNVKIDTFTIK